MAIQRTILALRASGGIATSGASKEAPTAVTGTIKAIHVAYGGTQASPTVVVTAEGQAGAPDRILLDLAGASTDAWFQPRIYQQDTEGVDLTYDELNEIPCDIPVYGAIISAAVDEANNNDEITVTILYET